MKETNRISKLFEAIYDGSPWIDVNLTGTLKNISAAQAAEKIRKDCNSIWEITNHIISWRKNVLKRINGEIVVSPANNYFSAVKNSSEEAWQQTLQNLAVTQQEWILFLNEFDEARFEKVYPGNGMNYYEHMQGIIQHDAYHLGQIVLLLKLK